LAKAKRTLKWQRDPEGMRLRILEAERAPLNWRERRWIDVAAIKV
jgi:hypothetical protein